MERGMTMNEQFLDFWVPNEWLIDWAKQFFDSVNIGEIWAPEGSGISYVKTSDNAWSVIQMVGHPMATSYHIKFRKTFAAIDVEILEKSDSYRIQKSQY